MSRKIPGSAIVPGTITVTQITGGLNDTTNASYAQANTARTTANDAYGQANTARADANTTFGTINTTFGTVNSSFGTVNTNYQAAYAQANTARTTANDAYGAANTKLSTSGGSISGDLAITGNLTIQGNATTINVSNLSVNDSIILLSANAVGDSNDIGFIGHFDRGATATHAGLIRKATENRFYLFDNSEVEPSNNVIDVAGNNFRVGNLRLGIINANSFVTAAGLDVTGQANTARTTANDAYGQANTARNTANSAYGQANTATTNAGNAYDTANSAYTASNRLITQDLRTIAPNSHTAGRLTFGFTSYTNNGNASSYADYLHFRSYIDSSGGSDNLVMFHKSGIGMRIWQQTWNSSTAYSNYVDVLHSSNYSSYAVPLSGGTMTGQLNISSGGLLVTGNVGIGTASPEARLDIIGATQGTITTLGSEVPGLILQQRLTSDSNGDAGPMIDFRTSNGSDIWTQGAIATIAAGTYAGEMAFYTQPGGTTDSTGRRTKGASLVERMRINLSGNIGIGTTSPSYPLQVRRPGGACSLGLTMDNYGAIAELARSIFYYAIGDSTSDRTGHLFFTRNATATDNLRLVINSAGNVGIGTASPASLLDVRGSLIVNGTGVVNGASLTAIRTDLSSSLSVGYFGTGSQGLFIKNDSSDSKYMQFYSSGDYAGGYRFYVGNTLAFQLDTGAGATFYGSGSFASSVMCLKSTQSSANTDMLGDLDSYGGSTYDGYYAVSRPTYSSGVMQFNVAGSVGTIQFSFIYAGSAYRRNKTDNITWSAWRQVD